MQAGPCRCHAVSLLLDFALPVPPLLVQEASLTLQWEGRVPLLGSHSISLPALISPSAASAPKPQVLPG